MNWRDARTDKLHSSLVELKLIFEFPKEYLTHYFKNLKNKVDSSALSLLSLYKTNKIIIDKINGCWELIINRIKQFEQECLGNLSLMNNISDENSSSAQRIKQIEVKLNNLNENMPNSALEQLLHDEFIKLEKIVFQNKCLLYFDDRNGTELMRDLPCFYIGKLIYVSNEYFDQEKVELFFRYLYWLFCLII
jgi:hypothetical protein